MENINRDNGQAFYRVKKQRDFQTMITVPKIQIALKNEFDKSSVVMAPNIFLWPPFESDLVRVTKSMYAIEYEIKLTKSDFKADFKKSKLKIEGFENRRVKYSSKSKHDWLLEGNGATEFYYVFPYNLIKHESVPEWAGIIEVHEVASTINLFCVRKARRLNKTCISDQKLKDIYTSCYYRYWAEVSKRNTNQILML